MRSTSSPVRRLHRGDFQGNRVECVFGEWQLVREWGRIGQGDTVRACTYPARDEAEKAQAHSIIHKLQRGYIPVSSSRERHVESGNKNVDKRRLSLYK